MSDPAAEPKPEDGHVSSDESDWDNDDPDLIDDFKTFTQNQPDYYTMHASGGMVTITPATSKTHIVAAPVEVEVDWAYGGNEVFVYTSFDDFQTAIPLEAKPNELTDELLHTGTVLLPPGRYLIRYLVDGEWMVDDNQEVVCSLGNEYNSILVEDPNAEAEGSSDDETTIGDDDLNDLDEALPDNFKSGSGSDLFGTPVDTSKGMINISPDTFKDLESMTAEEKNKILMAGDVDAIHGKRASLVWDSHKRAFVIAKPEPETELDLETEDTKSESSASATDDKRKEKEKARRKLKKKRQKEKRKKVQQRSAYGAAAARAAKAADIAAIKEEIVKREREWREAWILHELKTREDHEKEKESMRTQWKDEREQWISKIKSYSSEAHQLRTINQELHHQLEEANRGVALQTAALQREQEKFTEQHKLLEDELTTSRKSVSDLRDQLTAARDEASAIRAQLDQSSSMSRSESEALRAAESKSKLQLEQVQRELSDAKAECKALEQQIQTSKSEYEARIEGMKKDFELKSQETSSALTTATQNLEQVMTTRIQELNTQVDQKTSQLNEAREELKNAQKQLSEAKREASTLQGELTSKIAELEQARKDRTASDAQVAELNKKIAQLAGERKDADSAHNTKISDLETQLNKLRASVLQKQAKMDDAIAELEKFKSDAALKEADVAREREEFKRQLERSAARSKGLQDKADVVVKNAQAIRSTMSGFKEQNLKEIAALKSGLEDSKKFLLNSLNMQSRLLDATMKKYKKELSERRKYFNMVQELKGNIRVFCRCRPFIDEDAKKGSGNAAQFPEENTIRIVTDKRDSEFEFDRVFGPTSTQVDVFAETKMLVTSCMDGYNVCIFAYGQTGSGKTFTMEGVPDNRGVNYRAITELFRVRDERTEDYSYKISVSMLEIYNESIRDLLADKQAATSDESKSLKVHKGAQGMYVEGLTEWPVSTEADVLKAINVGSKNRSTGVTNMNEHSSRSHCLVSVRVEGQNLAAGITYVGKLHLIDLAGSERVSKSGATGDRLKEAQAINRSLSALGNVIEALQKKTQHIPYRNSKLTFLLQDSLGGHAKTLMFINVSPTASDAEETLCSLNFASRVMKVELGAAVRSTGAAEALAGTAPADEDKGDFVTDDGAPEDEPADGADKPAAPAAAAAPKPAAAAVKKPVTGARPAASTTAAPKKPVTVAKPAVAAKPAVKK